MGQKDTVTKSYMSKKKCSYLILGIENQSDVHYAMPVKNLIYDALNYGQQISQKNKGTSKRGQAEKSGISFRI